jgi:hypothetical protein
VFTPSSTPPANPPDVLEAVAEYLKQALRDKPFAAGVVEDILYHKEAVGVTFAVPGAEKLYSAYFVLIDECLVVQNNQHPNKHGPVFPLGDPELFERLTRYLDVWYGTLSQLTAMQHQCDDTSKRINGDSGGKATSV